jgi:hypothetical protein
MKSLPMALKKKSPAPGLPAVLAQQLSEALLRERIIPRFVDSYVVEHGRYGIQVHASLYRDLLTLLQREALLAGSARALEMMREGSANGSSKPVPMKRKDAAHFRQKYVSALNKLQRWNAGDALDFQSDLQMYEEIIARAAAPRRSRKPFEVANHPFVDRCAFVLDSSFMEKARLAASKALTNIETLTAQILGNIAGDPAVTKPSR